MHQPDLAEQEGHDLGAYRIGKLVVILGVQMDAVGAGEHDLRMLRCRVPRCFDLLAIVLGTNDLQLHFHKPRLRWASAR